MFDATGVEIVHLSGKEKGTHGPDIITYKMHMHSVDAYNLY